MQTIFALATARGKSGVAVVRISGPDAFEIGRRLAGELPDPNRFLYRRLEGSGGSLIDRGLVLVFEAPKSFTGEDVVELQIHGSVAVIGAIETAILETGLARPAEAGEFTRRALLNERMDLGQVEALGDLIEAETEQQRAAAQAMLEGGLRQLADDLRRDLLRAVALIEVTIDFADEEVPVDVSPEVRDLLSNVLQRLQAEIEGSHVAERLRDGFEVAIIGAPNSGKSTLLNRIAGRDIAITSDIAGTTRDILEAKVDLGGVPVTFLDTAGLREAADGIERIGIDRAIQRAKAADLRLFLAVSEDETFEVAPQSGDLRYASKADLRTESGGLSGLTGQGVPKMLADVEAVLVKRLARAGTTNRMRHRNALSRAVDEIEQAVSYLDAMDENAEFAASHLRDAVRSLDDLVGAIDVESVLGEIFSQFCIGK